MFVFSCTLDNLTFAPLEVMPGMLSFFSHEVLCCYLGTAAAIQYGTRAISGFFSYDDVKVGDIVVKNQEMLILISSLFSFPRKEGVSSVGFFHNLLINQLIYSMFSFPSGIY